MVKLDFDATKMEPDDDYDEMAEKSESQDCDKFSILPSTSASSVAASNFNFPRLIPDPDWSGMAVE